MKILCLRYFFFVLGIFINSFGVAFVTKSDLGTTKISYFLCVLLLKFTNNNIGRAYCR